MEKNWKSFKTITACFDALENCTDPAVICAGERIRYRELIPEAKKMAKAMLLGGIKKGDRVILSMSYSIDMVCAYMAMVYAGIVIVFIDRSWPEERLAFIQKDCKAGLVLTDEVYASLKETKDKEEPGILLPAIEESDPYVVFYTSGSTGNPKGTVMHHSCIYSIVVPVPENVAYYDTWKRCNAIFSMGNIAYGATHGDLMFSLVSGRTLVLATEEERLSPALVGECILKNHADAMSGTPSMLQRFLEDETFARAFSGLKRLFIIGEALSVEVGDALLKKTPAVIYDAFGSSEAGFFAYDRVKEGTPVRLAFPTYQARLLVLDEEGNPAGEGIPGELGIGGSLSEHAYYIGLPELNEEKYIDLPMYGRVYRSGDRAVQDPDGVIRMAGRKDDMQKLHGQRLEPAEVELAIQKYPAVRQAAVQIRGKDKDAVLCAWYSAREKIDPDVLRRFLSESLPWYMVPVRYLQMEELPLNSSGKLDRRALPDIAASGQEYQAPQTETEAFLCLMFGKALRLRAPVGREDSFFLLGGDSMQGMLLLSFLSEKRGIHLSMKELFQNPTPASLAVVCEKRENDRDSAPDESLRHFPEKNRERVLPEIISGILPKEEIQAVFPVSNNVEIYLAMQKLHVTQSLNEINASAVCDFVWKEEELVERVQALVKNHPALRSYFVKDDSGKSWQVFRNDRKASLMENRLPSAGGKNSENQIWYKDIRRLSQESAQRFIRGFWQVLEESQQLWKIAYFVLGENRSMLLLSVSHTIADGVSLYVILNELCAPDYKALKKDTLLLHRAKLTGSNPGLPEEIAKYYSHPDLSLKRKDAMTRVDRFAFRRILLSAEETRQLKERCAGAAMTMYTFAQYCYGQTLLKVLRGRELWILSLEAGRYPQWGEELRIVGNLTVGIPVRITQTQTVFQFQEELEMLRNEPCLSEAKILYSPKWAGIYEGIVSNDFTMLPPGVQDLTLLDAGKSNGSSMWFKDECLCIELRYRDDPETDRQYGLAEQYLRERLLHGPAGDPGRENKSLQRDG